VVLRLEDIHGENTFLAGHTDRLAAGRTRSPPNCRVSPFAVIGSTADRRWTTLRRWARETIGGRLFATCRAPPENITWRKHAERAAALLQALAPTDPPLADAVFGGPLCTGLCDPDHRGRRFPPVVIPRARTGAAV
jgi:hypothetical protein